MSKSYEILKAELANLAHHRCEYCLSPEAFSTQSFELDHIVPESLGGETLLENSAYSCRGCNAHKFNKTTGVDEITGLFVDLFNPRQQI
jgi:5-methylcytosine-specific restriction endonuclease McrA